MWEVAGDYGAWGEGNKGKTGEPHRTEEGARGWKGENGS